MHIIDNQEIRNVALEPPAAGRVECAELAIAGDLHDYPRHHDGHDALAKASPRVDAQQVVELSRIVLLLCIPIAFAAHIIFTRLVAMIDSVDRGRVFAAENAQRLRIIGWCLLATQVIDAGYGWLSYQLGLASGEHFAWQPSLTAWLAVLMLFILARIFEQGAAMREELEQTI